jgi:hypothetical protein
MNFLSHFYFDRHAADSYHVTGTVLPDLLKNADKTINIHPEKLPDHPVTAVNCILQGWKRHLEVDNYFHSSAFFKHHSHQLKLVLAPAIEGSIVKPFFLGHIALELILDNLLLTTGKVNVDEFYTHLQVSDDAVIDAFLNYSSLTDTTRFFTFFDGFKKHSYLHTYADVAQVAYALKRICMRVWHNPFTAEHEADMIQVIQDYRTLLFKNFMSIFYDIESHLD